ncbi:MAG: tol-pal system protein YbgF [Hyphomonas sp.]|uniref:tol-pal system protein YbgF n=1 Tax=Hyphomonas sp. TaxID=87 RepID=UPI0025BB8D49|nr:tol-pal system protein YbgF [Hyphomonas sp.]MBA4337977.1 tol-pal system protein YbgF [Hyphomonas sp.]
MLKAALTSLAVAGLLVVPATSQTVTMPARVPITKGVTTGDLSVQVDQARQSAADLLVQVNRQQDQISTLSGRVESLEFQLGRATEANEELLTDNETLARDAQAMRQTLDRQARAIAGMQVILGIEPEPVTDTYSDVDPAGQSYAMTAPASNGRGVDSSGPAQLTTGSGLPEGSLGTLSASQLPGEAGALFAEAKARLIRLDYAGAEEAFQSFIDQFGKDAQAGEAHFWLGEALHQQQAYAESGAAYTTMIRSYPDDVRAPDALVRLARAMRFLGESTKACTALDTLPKRYPNATKVVRDLAAVERTRSGCAN